MSHWMSITLIAIAASLAAACTGDDDDDTERACAGRTGATGRHERTLTYDGLEREYALIVPQTAGPLPLVFNFHGLASDPGVQLANSEMAVRAEREGYIAVAPLGWGQTASWNAGACCPPANETDVDDVGFVRALLDEVEAEYCIDPRRVYATGKSNGGMMAHRLACEVSDRFAAIAPVASNLTLEECAPERAVSVMMFNGTADPLMPYEGGRYGPVETVSFARWAGIDGCTDEPEVSYAQGEVTCRTYGQCADDAAVTLCTIDGGGHTWPGSQTPTPIEETMDLGATTTDMHATDAMWEFFQAHPLP